MNIWATTASERVLTMMTMLGHWGDGWKVDDGISQLLLVTGHLLAA